MSSTSRATLESLAADLAASRTSARALTEACLARIEDEAGEGAFAFVHVDREAALLAAGAMDSLRAAGAAPSRFAGIPISIKDLFDVAGQVTRAGSIVLADAPAATADATAIARLRAAGFVLIGRTNMTEFAYSGLGMNPHYGTPRSPWRRAQARVPGGSSSGAGISVADAMAHGAVGTDTGGSCRIPAAFTGIVGWKPTARRVPLDGVVPLSPTLDSIGPLARSVGCCALLDAVLAGEPPSPPVARPVRGLRFAVPTTVALDDLDEAVARAFEAALTHLGRSGASVHHLAMPELGEIAPMSAAGGLTAAESYAWHRKLLAEKGARYDPRVASRIRRGEAITAADYLDLLAWRRSLVTRARERLSVYDALLLPTVPILPPRLEDLRDDAAYTRANLLALRNCTLVNMIDGCAISLPIPPSDPPVSLMIAGTGGADGRVLAIAAGVEAEFGSAPFD